MGSVCWLLIFIMIKIKQVHAYKRDTVAKSKHIYHKILIFILFFRIPLTSMEYLVMKLKTDS